MKTYNPAKFEDVLAFLGEVNQKEYGINPFKRDDELEVLGDLQAERDAEEAEINETEHEQD